MLNSIKRNIKNKRHFLLIVFVISLVKMTYAQSYCQNLGFEMGNFTNWTGYTWIYDTYKTPPFSTPKVEGIDLSRFSIMTEQSKYDENTGNKLKLIPPGFNYSARIGNSARMAHRQSLSYKIHVDDFNSLLVLHFAVVFEAPHQFHTKYEEPRFTITFYDENDSIIPNCANYDVYSSDSRISGFNIYIPTIQNTQNDSIYWRDWTAVGLNLSQYKGKDVKVEFMSADCSREGHYGYAYVAGECMPMQINVGFCALDKVATLYAPDGFIKYKWIENGNVIGTESKLTVNNPIEGQKYQCELTSETGCAVTLESTILRYNPVAQFTMNFDCSTNMALFKNNSTSNNGNLQYEWDFGDGTTSNETNPIHTYITTGPKTVRLIVKNPPSTCVDTMTQVVYAFNRQKVRIEGDTLYCPDKTITLYGKDAYSYKWNTGETTDSIKVGTTGTYSVVGYSKDGKCSSAPYSVNVSQKKDWDFELKSSANSFCEDGSVVLSVSSSTKGITYLWNTDETTNSIRTAKGGNFSVTATNLDGCIKQKTKNIYITEYEKPSGIQIQCNITDCKKHTVLFSSNPILDNTVSVKWDFGDGTTSTSKTPVHTYTQSGTYTVKLEVTSQYGCVNTFTLNKTFDFMDSKITISGDKQFCKGDSIILTASGASRYEWFDGSTNSSIKIKTAGRYWLIGYSVSDCPSDTVYYDVSFFPDWILDIQGDDYFCNGGVTVLTATGALKYHWNTGENADKISVGKEGIYTVMGTNENGCKLEKSILMKEIKLPKTDFELSTYTINVRNSSIIGSIPQEDKVTYLWEMGDGTQYTGNAISHTYNIDYSLWKYPVKLTATNEFGCINDTTKFVDVLFFVPNIFTPNGDGKNDLFMPNVKLSIYDRNGILIYQGNEGWDGNFKGTKAEGDTYFYHLTYKDTEGKDKSAKGYVILKR